MNNFILILILISLIIVIVFLVLILKAIKNIKQIEKVNVIGSERALNNKTKESFIVPDPKLDSILVNKTGKDLPLEDLF